MTIKTHKPGRLLVRWNKDMTYTIYGPDNKKLLRSMVHARDCVDIARSERETGQRLDTLTELVAPFAEGWFGTADRAQWKITKQYA